MFTVDRGPLKHLHPNTMKKRQRYSLVCVTWHDAAMHGTGQMSIDDINQYGLINGYSVGWLLQKTKTHVTLAMDFFPTDSPKDSDQFRTLQSYPLSGVKRIQRLKP